MVSQSDDLRESLLTSGYSDQGFAAHYDSCRPQVPRVLIDVLTQIAQSQRPKLVVDLGCGTGLSTRLWSEVAETVIGIEPNPQMRQQAIIHPETALNVTYRDGYSHQTGLPDGCADIVTCAQALHWMEPQSTFAEGVRVLRPGGIFAAYDYELPPAIHWEIEAAVFHSMQLVQAIRQKPEHVRTVRRWSKAEHLQRMEASGHFRYTRELYVHHVEMGDVTRLVAIIKSEATVSTLLEQGISETEIGLDEVRTAAHGIMGDKAVPWYFSFRVRLGVR